MAEPEVPETEMSEADAMLKRFSAQKDEYSPARDEAHMTAIRTRATVMMKEKSGQWNDPNNPIHVASALFQASMEYLDKIAKDPNITLTEAASISVASLAASSAATYTLFREANKPDANPATGLMTALSLLPVAMAAGLVEALPNIAQSPERQRIIDQAKAIMEDISPTPEPTKQELLEQVRAIKPGEGAARFNAMAQRALAADPEQRVDLAALLETGAPSDQPQDKQQQRRKPSSGVTLA
jgi:hypothetical protein